MPILSRLIDAIASMSLAAWWWPSLHQPHSDDYTGKLQFNFRYTSKIIMLIKLGIYFIVRIFHLRNAVVYSKIKVYTISSKIIVIMYRRYINHCWMPGSKKKYSEQVTIIILILPNWTSNLLSTINTTTTTIITAITTTIVTVIINMNL